jgi:hypothetical protein
MSRKGRTFTAVDGNEYVEYYDKKVEDYVIKRKIDWVKIFGWSHVFFILEV